MVFFGNDLKTLTQKAMLGVLLIIAAALFITLFLLSLSFLYFIWGVCVGGLGYKVNVSDEIAKTVLQVGGAVGVALVALFGVHRQNLSAERRHRLDSSLALKKDIFLRVAESYSLQYQLLLSFANPAFKDEDRQAMLKDSSKAFFSVHLVASQDTISAMLDVNREWAKALINISILSKQSENIGPENRLSFLAKIHELTPPFMDKLWRFNIIGRREIGSKFPEEDSYHKMVSEKYGEVAEFYDDIKRKLNKSE